MPSKNISFPALWGDVVAPQCRKDQLFGGGLPPPNPHRVSPEIEMKKTTRAITAGYNICAQKENSIGNHIS